jgi:RES domain-containing protein
MRRPRPATPRGAPFRTLYFALDPETALAEVLHHHRSQAVPDAEATPVTLFACRVDVERLLDLTDRRVRRLLGVSLRQLKQLWRPTQHAGQEALTQAIGRLARAHGFQGLLAPSARRRAGMNVIVFPERLGGDGLIVYHPEAFPADRGQRRA